LRPIGAGRVFHTVENFFPRCGKNGLEFSMVWKTGAEFFHGVEKFFPHRGKRAILSTMNTFFSAAMILWIFGMVIYLTKDM
jgi:hypothetical protein